MSPASPAQQVHSLLTEPLGKPIGMHIHANICDSLKVYSFSEVKHTSQNTEIINEQFNEFLQ